MDQYFSKAIKNGLTILNLFDRNHTRWSLSAISRATGINNTSAYRFLNTLVKLGYLKKTSSKKLLKLGPKALLLSHNFSQGFDLLQATKPLIDKTFIEYKITIDSALLDGLTLLALYRREAPNTIYYRQPLVMSDLYARAMGEAVLARLSEAELLRFIENVSMKKHTPKTLVKKEHLFAELEATRNRGYSINSEEYVLGLICIGSPLINFQTNTTVGAISFDFPSSEQSLSSIERKYAGILTKLAGEISEIITITES